jgi:hypothetical protein
VRIRLSEIRAMMEPIVPHDPKNILNCPNRRHLKRHITTEAQRAPR